MEINIHRLVIGFAIYISLVSLVKADGLAVDRIYAPYVNSLEKELEYRISSAEVGSGASNDYIVQRFGFGAAVNDSIALEAYVSAEGEGDANRLSGYELELRWQLSEQGEYAVDWGAVFEYEHSRDSKIEELAGKLVVLKEWGAMVTTANASLIYESSESTGEEFETALSLQARYRYRPMLEPALEFYAAEDYRGMGPVLVGAIRLAAANSLRWEVGTVFGLDEDSADYTFRLMLEYEFY
ncbi:hypothetical protein [Zhongshania aliphaticivorans]|uniref:hypothetical protein n=1 Tax=Zhongshania aliphaticivorans TaxID=1470434 RepID=UPI0012E4EE11|nr:hypothetical protein [Zhongshania aliphaticivorans]CAA0117916.1 Uncharacterised protein [Zhongshania aliphaticivorans]